MNKVKFLLVLAFLVVLAAGAVVGMAVDRQWRTQGPTAQPMGPHPHPPGPWGQFDRSLTSEQRDKMKAIWSVVDKERKERFTDHHQLAQKRDQAVLDLLTPEQRSKFDAIQAQYREDVDQVEKKLTDSVHHAEDQTRAMLSPDQLNLYENARAHGGPPGRRGGPRGTRFRPMSGPTTAPSPAL
jgi:Spy/CpxP family protein refolding chaperone